MPAPSVIIHERVANWSRQLRPRFQAWPIRWSETRSGRSLVRLAGRSACPVLVVDLITRPVDGLRELDEALQAAPRALSMVLDPLDRPEVASMARELGATIVLSGPVVPPEVERLLRRWLPIAGKRSEAAGWSAEAEPEPEAWGDPELFRPQDDANPTPTVDEPD